MSSFYRQADLILPHGFKDDSGKLHRNMTIRVPTYGDEVMAAADRADMLRAGEPFAKGPDATDVLFIVRLIVKWGEIVVPSHHHIMALRRADVAAIRAAIERLEAEDVGEVAKEERENNASGATSPK